MLTKSVLYPTLPAVDLFRARKFYETQLGLKIEMADENGFAVRVGDCRMYLYKRGPTKADHTVATFEVQDTEAEVKELKNKGVKFEEYDMPAFGLKTVNSIATMGGTKSAWFKDSEGNILGIVEMAKAKAMPNKQMAGARSSADEAFNY